MSRSRAPRCTPIAIERILEEFSDKEHELSVSKIRELLDEIYGIEVERDYISDVLNDLNEFYNDGYVVSAIKKILDRCLNDGTMPSDQFICEALKSDYRIYVDSQLVHDLLRRQEGYLFDKYVMLAIEDIKRGIPAGGETPNVDGIIEQLEGSYDIKPSSPAASAKETFESRIKRVLKELKNVGKPSGPGSSQRKGVRSTADILKSNREPALFPDAKFHTRAPAEGDSTFEQAFTLTRGSRNRAAIVERPFKDYEVAFLIDTIGSAAFVEMEESDDLILRIKSLEGPTAREENRLPLMQDGSRGIKPGLEDVVDRLDILRQAILEKKTISFYLDRYDITTKSMGIEGDSLFEAKLVSSNKDRMIPHRSVYRLYYTDGHYYACLSARNDAKARRRRKKRNPDADQFDHFEIEPVDLMRDVRIDEADNPGRYIELKKPDSPDKYFRTAIGRFGGNPETIRFRCSGRAYQDVVERFMGFPEFAMRPLNTCEYPDGVQGEKPSEKWYEISFSGSGMGFMCWSLRYPADIKILEPAEWRDKARRRLNNNAYGIIFGDEKAEGTGEADE